MTAAAPDGAAAAVLDDPLELAAFTRWDDAGARQGVAESALRIGGMHCAACAATVEDALRRVPGVLDAQVSSAAQCATVRWDPAVTRASALVQAVQAAGYGAVPDTAAAARGQRRQEFRTALWRLFVAAFCAMQVMMLATPAYVSAPGELSPDLKHLFDWGSWLLTLPVLGFSAAPFFGGAWRAVKQRRIGMDVPVALGIAVAFVASSGAAFDPGGLFGTEVYFDSLTMFVAFLLGGRFLEMRARHAAETSLEDASNRLPQAVMRLRDDGSVEVVSAQRLARGDRVRVPVGQAFPADGALTDGATQVDEALLTGESRPVAKASGDTLVAGSLNLESPVVMRVDRVGADTRFEAIAALMRAARTQRPALLASADRWAGPFLWAVLVAAALAGVAWSVVDPSRAIGVLVAVLIVTCPCALSLAAPSALLAAAGAMGRHGVLLRRLDAIEGLARMDLLFVDKTGTLTQGRLHCVAAQSLAGGALDAALPGVAASLAGWSSHPLAAALRDAHAASGQAWSEVSEVPGSGIQAMDAQGHRWRLGSAAWTGTEADSAQTQVFLARDGQALARFVFDEHLRDDALTAVQALQADGVRVGLLSGDSDGRVQHVAGALGITSAAGALQPADKLAAVRAAQQRGDVVAMLGDGVNDAPVLAQANVSLAMGEGALLARTQADAIVISNRLSDVAHARALARRALRVVHQNLAWAAAYNAACVPLALVGWLPPWAAGLGMASSSLLVVLNSMRLSRTPASAASGVNAGSSARRDLKPTPKGHEPWTSSTC